jgi:hypothetical protein
MSPWKEGSRIPEASFDLLLAAFNKACGWGRRRLNVKRRRPPTLDLFDDPVEEGDEKF